jgi:hypothetical protein
MSLSFGVQSNVEQFYVGENPNQYALGGNLLKINFPLAIPAITRNTNNGAEPRNNPVYNMYDTVRWLRGATTWSQGFRSCAPRCGILFMETPGFRT